MSEVFRRPPARPGLPGPWTGALFIVAALLPVLAASLSGVEAAGVWSELGAGLGLTGGALLFLQFWSSGRYEVLSGRVGIDRTMGFHRISAFALVAFAVAHPLAYVLETAMADPLAAWQRLTGMLTAQRLSSGVLALAALLVLVVTSVWRGCLFRRYEHWRAVHGVLAATAGVLVLHHALVAGAYSATPLTGAVWAIFAGGAVVALAIIYLVRPWRMLREGWTVDGVAALGDKTWQVTLAGPASTRLRFRGGQFLWVTFAPHRPPLHDHPFSIASSPAELPKLRLVVREAGDCTGGFGELAAGTPAAVDGPHGSFVLDEGSGPVLLVAGGVGIAPILGLLEEAASRGDRRRFVLLYGDRSAGALAGRERLGVLQGRLDLDVRCFVDQYQGEAGLEAGPLPAAAIGRIVAGDPASWSAFVCGPAGMTERMTDALAAAGVAAADIHYERFDYGTGGGRLDRRRRRQALLIISALVAGVAAFAVRATG